MISKHIVTQTPHFNATLSMQSQKGTSYQENEQLKDCVFLLFVVVQSSPYMFIRAVEIVGLCNDYKVLIFNCNFTLQQLM